MQLNTESKPFNYEEWLKNEYEMFEDALEECASIEEKFLNFKSNKQIQKMLSSSGINDYTEFVDIVKNLDIPIEEIKEIDSIGNPIIGYNINGTYLSGITLRYIFYANKIVEIFEQKEELKNDIRIVEIGAGYGGFCAILDAIAKYKKIKIVDYATMDLKKAQVFQEHYIKKSLKDDVHIQNLIKDIKKLY